MDGRKKLPDDPGFTSIRDEQCPLLLRALREHNRLAAEQMKGACILYKDQRRLIIFHRQHYTVAEYLEQILEQFLNDKNINTIADEVRKAQFLTAVFQVLINFIETCGSDQFNNIVATMYQRTITKGFKFSELLPNHFIENEKFKNLISRQLDYMQKKIPAKDLVQTLFEANRLHDPRVSLATANICQTLEAKLTHNAELDRKHFKNGR